MKIMMKHYISNSEQPSNATTK